MSGDVTAAARVGSLSPMSEPPLFRGVVTESLSAGGSHLIQASDVFYHISPRAD